MSKKQEKKINPTPGSFACDAVCGYAKVERKTAECTKIGDWEISDRDKEYTVEINSTGELKIYHNVFIRPGAGRDITEADNLILFAVDDVEFLRFQPGDPERCIVIRKPRNRELAGNALEQILDALEDFIQAAREKLKAE